MGIVATTTQVATNTTTGNQTITDTDLGGLTPKGALFTVSVGTVNGTPAANSILSFGGTDGVNQFAVGQVCQNGVGTTNTSRQSVTDECVFIYGAGGGVDGEANFVSFGVNSVTINWGNAPAAAYLLTVYFFAGSDLSADVDTIRPANGVAATVSTTAPGFEPDVVFFASPDFSNDSGALTNVFTSYGVATNETSIEQACIGLFSFDGQATSANSGRITNSYCIGQVATSGAWTWAAELTSFDANGFTLTTREGASGGADDVEFLALNFDGAADFALDIINTPTSTGNQAYTDPGFTPQFVMHYLTQMPALDTSYTAGEAGSYGWGTFDEDDEYSVSGQDEDGQGTSDTQSLADNTAVNLPLDDGTAGHVASFVSFDASGYTLNFSTTRGTAIKHIALAIESDVATTTTTTTSTSSTSTSTSSTTSTSTSTTSTTSTSSTSTTTLSTTSTTTLQPVTTRSHRQSRSISINVFTPTIGSYIPRGLYEGEIGKNVNSYSQTIASVGGYLNASFTIYDRLNKIEDWLFGIGRHVETYNPSLNRIWEGFVNRVTLNIGSLSVVRGPLMDIANKVSVIYSSVDTDTSPPTVGVRNRTTPESSTTSQEKYGIIEKILSVGGTTSDEAEQIRDTWLSENNEPETSQQFNNQSVAQPSVTVECLGYVNWLNLYAYNQTASTGKIDVSTQIENVLAADPNSLFSTDYSGIDTNTLQVNRYTNDDIKGWDYIKAMTSRGDINDNRYTFGIYNDRKAIYTIQPSTNEYVQRLTDPKVRVETTSGQEVFPWDVTAARWLFYPDFLIGRTSPSDLRDDPRYEFIETVSYSTPWGLTHNGSQTGRLSQKLAKLGLGGVG